MPDPLSPAVAAGVAKSLAGPATTWIWDKAKDAKYVRDLRRLVGGEELHPKVKKVFERAVADASQGLPHLSDQAVEDFTSAPANRQILRQWIWEPERAELQMERLDLSSAAGRQEQANLRHFIERLPEAIEHHRKDVFDDESWLVIRQVTATIREESGKTRAHVTQEGQRRDKTVEREHQKSRKHFDSRVEQMKDDLLSELKASGGGDQSRVEASIQEDLGEIERLIEKKRIEPALNMGHRTLSKIEREGLSEEAHRTAHQHLANAYLTTTNREGEALPHVQYLADHAPNENARLRNQALGAYLRSDPERALTLAEKALAEDPDDQTTLLLKAHVLARSGKEGGAADFYEDVANLSKADDLYNLGQIEILAGRYERALGRAQNALEQGFSGPDVRFLYGISVVFQRQEQVECGKVGLPDTMREKLSEAKNHLGRAIDSFEEMPGRAASAYFYRGVVHLQLGDDGKGMEDLKRAHELTPSDPAALHNLVLLALDRGDATQARRYFEKLSAADHDVDLATMLSMETAIFHLEGNPHGAVDALRDSLSDELPDDTEFRVRLQLMKALRENLEPEKAEEILGALRSERPGHPQLLAEEGFIARDRDDLDRAVENFRRAREEAQGQLVAYATAKLADVLFERAQSTGSSEDFEEALQLYRKRPLPSSRDQAIVKEALCLLHLGRYPECVDVCHTHLGDGSPRPVLKKILARVHAFHENYRKAADLYKQVAVQGDTDAEALLHCSQCYAMIGEGSKASGAADKVAGQVEDSSPLDQLMLSQTYLACGELESAVRHAYLAQKHGPDERQCLEQYIWLFLTRSGDIEDRDAAEEKHIQAYQGLLVEYTERFPNSEFLQQIEVPQDPEEVLQALRKRLPSPKQKETFEKALRETPLPIGTIAEFSGRSVADTWKLVTTSPDLEVAADEGPRELLARELEHAREADAIILDLVPLLTISELGLLDRLSTCFEHIYVPQAAFNDLNDLLRRELSEEGESRRYLSRDPESDAGIALTEFPPEPRDAFLEDLRELRDFIRETGPVDLIGQTIGREAPDVGEGDLFSEETAHWGSDNREKSVEDEPPADHDASATEKVSTSDDATGRDEASPSDEASAGDKGASEEASTGGQVPTDGKEPADYEDLIGRPAAELIREGPIRGLTIYAEDHLVRKIARSEDARAFGIRALLGALREAEEISEWEYHYSRIRLLEMGYGFPFTSAETIAFAIREEGIPASLSRAALQALEDPRNDVQPVFCIALRLLLWLWSTHQGPVYINSGQSLTVTWSWRVLDAVSSNESEKRLELIEDLHATFQAARSSIVSLLGREKCAGLVQSVHMWKDEVFREHEGKNQTE